MSSAKKKDGFRIVSGKILGVDYGSKRIGLALSDNGQNQSFAYGTLASDAETLEKIKDICQKESVDKIVVGLPLGMSGNYTQKTEEVIYFISTLENWVKIPVTSVDERLTTVEARRNDNGQGIDAEAARIILEQYLESNGHL